MKLVLVAVAVALAVWAVTQPGRKRPAAPRAMPEYFADGCILEGESEGEDGTLYRHWTCPVESLAPGLGVEV